MELAQAQPGQSRGHLCEGPRTQGQPAHLPAANYRARKVRGKTPKIGLPSRVERRRSGILNPDPQSLQRYFVLLVKRAINRSGPLTALTNRFSDLHFGQDLRENVFINRAQQTIPAIEGPPPVILLASKVDPAIKNQYPGGSTGGTS